MYFRLTELLSRRLVEELDRYWSQHAAYPDLVVSGKHSVRERPQRGLVVKIGGASPIMQSADQYRGLVISRVHLTYLPDQPGSFVEWVREDPSAILPNRPFPSPPGLYWLNLIEKQNPSRFAIEVTVCLDVSKEPLRHREGVTYLTSRPFIPRSCRVRILPWDYVLEESEFTTIPAEGVVRLRQPLAKNEIALADYRYFAEDRGPYLINPNRPLTEAVPGCTIAIGRNLWVGDVVGVVVEPRSRPASIEYGGQWELTADIDVFARDVHDQREIADRTAMYLWGIARSRLSSEGIEITQISIGGDSEETYDDNAQEPYFTSSISLTCQTEWSVHVPLDLPIRKAEAYTTTGPLPPGPPPGTDTERIR